MASLARAATIKTSMGDIRVALFPETAPMTVENFIGLATGTKAWRDPRNGTEQTTPLYSGTIFHRVIPNFMVQAGDPLGTGTGGPGYRFGDEVDGPQRFDRPGLLAMANAGPGTNGSQFFITQVATPWLDGKHTIFGEVTDGMAVVDAIAGVARDSQDRPAQPIVIERIEVDDAG